MNNTEHSSVSRRQMLAAIGGVGAVGAGATMVLGSCSGGETSIEEAKSTGSVMIRPENVTWFQAHVVENPVNKPYFVIEDNTGRMPLAPMLLGEKAQQKKENNNLVDSCVHCFVAKWSDREYYLGGIYVNKSNAEFT